jgi:hypothetical protein
MGSYALKIVLLDIGKLVFSIINVKDVSMVNFQMNGTSINVKTGEIAPLVLMLSRMAPVFQIVYARGVQQGNFLCRSTPTA